MKSLSLISSGAVLGSSTVIRVEQGFAIQQSNASLSEETNSCLKTVHNAELFFPNKKLSEQQTKSINDFCTTLGFPATYTVNKFEGALTLQEASSHTTEQCNGASRCVAPIVYDAQGHPGKEMKLPGGTFLPDQKCRRGQDFIGESGLSSVAAQFIGPFTTMQEALNPCTRTGTDGQKEFAEFVSFAATGNPFATGFEGESNQCGSVNLDYPIPLGGDSTYNLPIVVPTFCKTSAPVRVDESGWWFANSKCVAPTIAEIKNVEKAVANAALQELKLFIEKVEQAVAQKVEEAVLNEIVTFIKKVAGAHR